MTYSSYKTQSYNKLNNTRDEKIKKAIEYKEKSIAKFSDKKTIGIAISSAFNNASQICVALLNTGKLTEENFWVKHSIIYKTYLKLFVEAQNDTDLYNRFMNKNPQQNSIIPDNTLPTIQVEEL